MTSEELAAIKERLTKLPPGANKLAMWMDLDFNIAPLAKDALMLLAAVEEQQRELDFLRSVVRDLTEESDAIKEAVKLRKEKEESQKKNAVELMNALTSAASKFGIGF